MGLGKTYSTQYLLDSNNNSGAAGQVLISTSTGIDWSDGSAIIGGPYLPLSAGSGERVTGDLYISDKLYMRPSPTYGSGYNVMTVIGTNSAPYTSTLSFSNYSQNDVMVIQGSNVGIGVTGPQQKLHVVSTDGANIILNSNTGAENNGIFMTESGVATPYVNGAYVYYDGSNNEFKINTGTASLSTRFTIAKDTGAIKFNAYGAGTLVTDASGNITAATSGPGTGTVTGTGTTGVLTKFTDGANGVIGDSILAVTADSLDFTNADFAQIKFKESGAIMIDSDNDQSSRNFQIKDGSGSSLLTVLDTGNVNIPNGNLGIGFSAAAGIPLQISTTDERGSYLASTVADKLIYTQINASSSTAGVITGAAAIELVGQANASGHGRHVWIGAEGTSNTTFETKLKFKIRGETSPRTGYDWTGSTEAPTIMTLEGSGNVGIGTVSPETNLMIYDTVDEDPAEPGFATTGMFALNTGNQATLSMGVGANNAYWMSNVNRSFTGPNYYNILLNPLGGKVGIGVSDPQAKLEVMGASASPGDGNEVISVTNTTGGTKLLLGVAENNYGWVQSAEGATYRNLLLNPLGGNVGIATSAPTNYTLEVNGTVAGSSFGTDENTTARIFAPSGAAYNGSGTQTGYLIMELPDNAGGGINNMMSGVIRVFDYSSGEGFDMRFAGYWYSGYNWTNCTAFVINQPGIERNFNVRFGKSTGASGSEDRPYIAIADPTSIWSYCKFSVTEYTSGHSNMNLYKWNSGWAASLSATLPGTVLRTISNTQTNNWTRKGSDMYSGNSGNVGIGTTSPSKKLHVKESTTATYAAYIENSIAGGDYLAMIGDAGDNVFEFDSGGTGGEAQMKMYSDGVLKNLLNANGSSYFTGSVGIGVTNPGTTRLQVATATSGPVVKFDNTSGTGGSGLEVNGGSSSGGFALKVGSYTGSELMRVQGNGNVGIGTNGPNTQLEISNINDNPATLRLSSDVTDGDAVAAIISFSNDAGGGGVQGRIENIATEDDTTIFKFYTDNTSSPSMTLNDSGNMTIAGTATATNFILSSDKTLKDNIKEIDTKHIDVEWKNFELISEPGVKRSGVIAQELEEKHPEFVRTDDEGLKSVAYIDLLISKIAELEARLEKAGL